MQEGGDDGHDGTGRWPGGARLSRAPQPLIPGRRSRRHPVRHDAHRYRERWLIEATVGRLKDCRRAATRYDKLAVDCLSAVTLATLVTFYL